MNVVDEVLGGHWFEQVCLAYLSQLLHGILGGAGAAWLAGKLLKRANYRVVGAIAASAVALLATVTLPDRLKIHGLDLGALALVSNAGGMIAGLVLVSRQITQPGLADTGSATTGITPNTSPLAA